MTDDRPRVLVSPIDSHAANGVDQDRLCGADKGRMSRDGGICTNPATYIVAQPMSQGGTYVTCCGLHLRGEIDVSLAMQRRQNHENNGR